MDNLFQREFSQKLMLIKDDIKNANLIVDLLDLKDIEDGNIPIYINGIFEVLKHLLKTQFDNIKTNNTDIGEKFTSWITTRYLEFINVIINLIPKNNYKQLNINKGKILYEILKSLLSMNSSEFREEVIPQIKYFLQYADIRYHILKSTLNIISSADNTDTILKTKKHFVLNMYSLLIVITSLSQKYNNKGTKLYHIVSPLYFNKEDTEIINVNVEIEVLNVNLPFTGIDENENVLDIKRKNGITVGCYKQLLSKIWLKYLENCQLDVKIYTKLLRILDTKIVPFIEKPLLLSDFLMRSFDSNIVMVHSSQIPISCLNSIFLLMQQCGLEYPDFYGKLYSLLTADTMHLTDSDLLYRRKFFQSLDMFLNSTHIPSYIICAFVKKLCRLLVTCGLSSSLVCLSLGLIKNLLSRHPECQKKMFMDHFSDTTKNLIEAKNIDLLDTFLVEEARILNQNNSTEYPLWELSTLTCHHSATVRRLANNLMQQLCKSKIDSSMNELKEVDLEVYFETNDYQIYKNDILLSKNPVKTI
ncbi:unnamed protein product [Gordionus sp. m RMFG-2023]